MTPLTAKLVELLVKTLSSYACTGNTVFRFSLNVQHHIHKLDRHCNYAFYNTELTGDESLCIKAIVHKGASSHIISKNTYFRSEVLNVKICSYNSFYKKTHNPSPEKHSCL